MSFKLQALGNRIIVKVEGDDKAHERVSKGGVIIPEVAADAHPLIGEVLSVGAKVEELIITGDRIWFGKYTGTYFEYEGEKYRSVDINDVLQVEV